jgi:hypothetical protein
MWHEVLTQSPETLAPCCESSEPFTQSRFFAISIENGQRHTQMRNLGNPEANTEETPENILNTKT